MGTTVKTVNSAAISMIGSGRGLRTEQPKLLARAAGTLSECRRKESPRVFFICTKGGRGGAGPEARARVLKIGDLELESPRRRRPRSAGRSPCAAGVAACRPLPPPFPIETTREFAIRPSVPTNEPTKSSAARVMSLPRRAGALVRRRVPQPCAGYGICPATCCISSLSYQQIQLR
jgi:hypothetical protein